MRSSTSALLPWFGLTLLASLMLYHTSDRVTALDKDLRRINAQIETERQSLHVLKAEWTYLANPTRVEAAAKRYLDMQPTATKRVVSTTTLASALPLRANPLEAAPTQFADAGTAPAPQAATAATAAAADAQPAKSARVFASAATTRGASVDAHINERMVLQHTAAAEASPDRIGALINSLSLRP